MVDDHNMTARKCLRGIRGCATDDQYTDAVERVSAALQAAFDMGFRAAGGKISPLIEIEQ